MLTLLTEARFWTAREDIIIKETDFGAFRYTDKKEQVTSDYADGKRDYAERRDVTCKLQNKKPTKLKSCIQKLEEHLKHNKIVYCQWRDNAVIQILLSNGLLVHVCINIFTGDIVRMAFDKFFIGKLISETVTDALFTRMHILIAYNQNQLTFVYLQKPSMKRSAPEKISRMDPKIFNVIINGPQNRTISRHLACNNSLDYVAVWTKSSQNEVYPWRPTVRDQDRANVHVYKISRTKLESICYYWTENDPINVEFSKTNQNQLHSVEQKISRKGEVTIEICMYEINKSKLHRMSVTTIPLQTQVCCHAFSPDNEKLMLGCIDGSVILFDEGRGITHLVKAAFIPTIVSWHCDSALVMVANERCQFQCFDISLACVKNQLISEDMTPSNLLDLSGYFMTQPNLLKIGWSKKPDLALHNEKYTQNDCYLLLLFENGPAACLRFFGGNGLKGDVHTSGFTADVLIHKYLNLNHIEKAINVLLCLNWDTYGAMCLISLHKIASYIFKGPLTADREVQLQKALGSFHVPVKPLCEETELEFGDQVRDLTRKFFQYLLRYKSYEKAFSLAIDINDEDLFMDLHNCAKSSGHLDLATDAYQKAEEILNRSESRSSIHSTCSHSSCSNCGASSVENFDDDDLSKMSENDYATTKVNSTQRKLSSSGLPSSFKDHPPLPVFPVKKSHQKQWPQLSDQTYVPPLPYFHTNSSTTSDVRINIPKPELKVSAYSKKQSKNIAAKNRYRAAAASFDYQLPTLTSDNILLVDPPLPNIKKTSSQDNLIHNYPDFLPTRTQLYHNSFSTDALNSLDQLKLPETPVKYSLDVSNSATKLGKNMKSMYQQPSKSLATTKSSLLSPHIVIDVVPNPQDSSKESWKVPDQTIGIPLTITKPSPYKKYLMRPPAANPYSALGHSSAHHQKTLLKSQSMYNINSSAAAPPLSIPPVIHQHPIALANIPPPPSASVVDGPSMGTMYKIKKSVASIGSASSAASTAIYTKEGSMSSSGTSATTNSILSARKESGEKNKVKFSDTVTVAVVPEIARKEKPINDRLKRPTNGFHSRLTNPQKELADSLPLCHPNDDYLKDFTPMAQDSKKENEGKNNTNRTNSSSIKVVHFGVV